MRPVCWRAELSRNLRKKHRIHSQAKSCQAPWHPLFLKAYYETLQQYGQLHIDHQGAVHSTFQELSSRAERDRPKDGHAESRDPASAVPRQEAGRGVLRRSSSGEVPGDNACPGSRQTQGSFDSVNDDRAKSDTEKSADLATFSRPLPRFLHQQVGHFPLHLRRPAPRVPRVPRGPTCGWSCLAFCSLAQYPLTIVIPNRLQPVRNLLHCPKREADSSLRSE